jgi:ABC-2 type transport system permease protein
MDLSITKAQFVAIAKVRWQFFVHSLRTTRGTAELVSRVFVGLLVLGAGVGGAIGLGAAAWNFVSQGSAEWLALLLWFVFMFWQFFPVVATAFTESTDSSIFLRFPLSYRAYFLVILAFGSLDIATALGSFWLLGIFSGIAIADPTLIFWTALIFSAFAAVNIVLARTIFSWIERWLAQRRTREIFGILFFLFIISVQLIGPLLNRYGDRPRPDVVRFGQQLTPLQRALPPGLAADAINHFHSNAFRAAMSLALLCAYGACFLWLLNFRLRAQYRGENLSETSARSSRKAGKQTVRPGWNLPGLSSGTAAIFEKELLYLSRSGPMLFTLVMPIVMLVVFRFGGAGAGKNGGLLMRTPDFGFPIGATYALLVLTNLIYNNFGADGGGIQFLFALPVRFRQIVFAKNLAHLTVLAIELLLVWSAVFFFYRPPRFDITVATIAAMLFAVPVNFSAGNLLSIYSPKKIEFSTFGRQRASQTTILISFLVQIVVFGTAILVFSFAPQYGGYWPAAIIFLLLAAVTCSGYVLLLNRMDSMALGRRELMISELSRA